MLVTEFTGSASMRSRPPDISFTLAAQFVNIVWKMSLPAQPDWIFQVIALAAGAVVGCVVAAVPPVAAAGADDVAGAFDDRHADRNAPRPPSAPVLRKLRRETLERRPTACLPPTPVTRRDAAVRPRPRDSIPRVSLCQVAVSPGGHPSAQARRDPDRRFLWYVRLDPQG